MVWYKPPTQGCLSAGPKTCPGVGGTDLEKGEGKGRVVERFEVAGMRPASDQGELV